MSQEIYSYERDFTNKDDYNFEEIIFYNTIEKINLFGTLVTPKIDYNKIVIIVPGTGKDTRHSHFILAEELVKSGIAVFRFDERGVGKSEGVFSPFSSHLSQDTYFSYLKLRDDKRFEHKEIGIIGHSLGGIAAVNTYEKIPDLDFLVLIGTPVKKNGDFSYRKLALGYEIHIMGGAAGIIGGQVGPVGGKVVFLGGEDAGYLYTYGGTESGGQLRLLAAESGVDVSYTWFAGYGNGGSSTFEGGYEYVSGSGSLDSTGVLTPGVSASIGGTIGLATSQHWTVISFGVTGSLAGGISTPVAIQFGKGIGRINIIQNIGPKSTIEILESWFR